MGACCQKRPLDCLEMVFMPLKESSNQLSAEKSSEMLLVEVQRENNDTLKYQSIPSLFVIIISFEVYNSLW